MLKLILIVAAAVLFGLDGLRLDIPHISCTPAAFCCLTVALLLL